MSQHLHSTRIPGCFRCELGHDEALSAMAEEYWEGTLVGLLVGVPDKELASMRLRYVSSGGLHS